MALPIPVPPFPPATEPVEELVNTFLHFLALDKLSDPFAKVELAAPVGRGEYVYHNGTMYLVVEIVHRPIADEYQVVLVVTPVKEG